MSCTGKVVPSLRWRTRSRFQRRTCEQVARRERMPVLPRREAARVAPQQLLHRVPVHLGFRLVHVEDAAGGVGDGHPELHGVDGLLELAQRVRVPLALDGVADRAREQAGLDLALDEVVLRSGLHGGEAQRVVLGGGEHEHGHGGERRAQVLHAGHAVGVGKAHVEEHGVDAAGGQAGERAGQAPADLHLPRARARRRSACRAGRGRRSGRPRPGAPASAAAASRMWQSAIWKASAAGPAAV